MKAHQGRVLVILSLALLLPVVRAQELEPQSPVGGPIVAPIILNGQRPSTALKSEKIRGSYLSGGIALGSIFTDNFLLSSTDQVSNVGYLVQPHVNVAQTRRRVNWQVGFEALLMVNHPIREENQAAEHLTLDVSYRLAQHVNLRVSSAVSNVNGLFSALNPVTSGPGIGVIQQANNSLLVPFTQRIISTSNLAELNYQFGPHSIVGARGTYSISDYPGFSNNAQFGSLYNSRMYSGETFYDSQISPRQWVGVTLRTQKFETKPLADTRAASFLLLYALNVRPHVTFALFAGPEWFESPQLSNVATADGLIRGWTPAGGATLTWQGVRTSVRAELSRQLNDGGGLASVVTFETANAELRRQLSSRQEVSFRFTYAKNDALESGQSLSGFFGQCQLQQRVAKSLITLIGYTREQQEYLNGHGTATANLLWLSLSYDFSRGLGR